MPLSLGPLSHSFAPLPAQGSVEAISLADLESFEVRSMVAAWQAMCGSRLIPPREALSLRELKSIVANISLARVLDGGEDYEFRIVGDAHVQAYGVSYQGKRLSDVARDSPHFARQLKASYELIRTSRAPRAFRGSIARHVPDARFVWFETAYFPFGASDDIVDHIVNVAVYAPGSGGWPG
ncbi:MAG: hypothetical protein HY243_06415 [Proteobacteria bacterium]|nr:hypothetical protein [Pseudomonadota bacterium]